MRPKRDYHEAPRLEATGAIRTHLLTLDFDEHMISGLLWDYGTVGVVDVSARPHDVSLADAKLALEVAVIDGRCKVPDDVRARVQAGTLKIGGPR